ncbi:MAG: 50S ribosomal protein L32 [Armatimonadetes bacterium]|nr:50S ribosomal protein L32 [Armatimonadota bacterium]
MTQKRRHSRTRTATRRSRWTAVPVTLVTCPQCKSRIAPHRVCPSCGHYAGREVIAIETDRPKKKKE